MLPLIRSRMQNVEGDTGVEQVFLDCCFCRILCCILICQSNFEGVGVGGQVSFEILLLLLLFLFFCCCFCCCCCCCFIGVEALIKILHTYLSNFEGGTGVEQVVLRLFLLLKR